MILGNNNNVLSSKKVHIWVIKFRGLLFNFEVNSTRENDKTDARSFQSFHVQ